MILPYSSSSERLRASQSDFSRIRRPSAPRMRCKVSSTLLSELFMREFMARSKIMPSKKKSAKPRKSRVFTSMTAPTSLSSVLKRRSATRSCSI